jgi:TonB-linked SusC/RagA family outer membrane protein
MRFRRCVIMPVLLVALAGTARAQGRTITGAVTDSSNGTPLAGVQVSLPIGGQRAQTRDDGSFTLRDVPEQDVTLLFRLIGYRRGEVRLAPGESGPVSIALARDPFKLEEVVVTGQATGQERRNLANAVATVTSEDLSQVPTASIEQQLQGKIAGADIQANSGAPGGGLQLKLRGVTSINAGTQPLYVIDGVIMSDASIVPNTDVLTNADRNGARIQNQENQVNRIADLDPSEVERIEVLKGASASAIYGLRASNGVVIITTKKGRPGRPQVNATQRVGFFELSNKIGERQFANADEVNRVYNKGVPGLGESFGCNATSCPFFDHEEELAGRKPLSHETLVTVSGGDDNTRYFGSGNLKHDGGIIDNTGFNRQSVRLNLDQQFGQRVKLSLNTNVAHTKADRGITNNDNNGISYYYVLSFVPSFSDIASRNPDGSFKINPWTTSNPLQTAALSTNDEDVWRYISGANLEWRAIQTDNSALRLIGNGGLDYFNQKNTLIFPTELQFVPPNGLRGTSALSKSDNTNLNLFGTVVHSFSPASKGFTATTSGGVQYSRRSLDVDRTVGQGLVGGQTNVNAGTSIQVSQGRELAKYLGYFLQEELLTMHDRLLLTAGIRADQSSLNADASKLFWYPKAAASFRFPSAFGQNGDLKFRAAYGQSGNEPTYGQIFTPVSSTTNINGLPSLVIPVVSTTGAPDLRPERMKEIEGGIDATLAGGRANLEFTAYQKNVSDLLLPRGLPESSGLVTEIFNGGSLRTRGLESALGIEVVQSKRFSWLLRTTFSLSRSVITRLDVPPFIPTQNNFGVSLGGAHKFEEGTSPTDIIGNDTVPGHPDSIIVVKVGDSNPTFRMGFSSDVTAGPFGLHALFDWQKGSNISNLTRLLWDADNGGLSPDFADPIPGSTQTVGERRLAGAGIVTANYTESASFLKLREVTVSYEVPASTVRSLFGGRSARLSLSARNLFTSTNYSGLDPEVSNFGNQAIYRNIDVAPFPPSRSFWFTLELGL